MRKLLRRILERPLTWIGNYLAAAPKMEDVHASLSKLYDSSKKPGENRVNVIEVDMRSTKFIILSDQHKGNRSWADDFQASEKNYIAALQYYNAATFSFINLGDSEELWKFKAKDIIPAYKDALAAEAVFQPTRLFKSFGNHDLLWKNKLDVTLLLKDVFQMPLPVCEGFVLRSNSADLPLDIFLTHGHQGDVMSDNNAFSTWIVAHIWMPLQRYLRLNINSPSKDFSLRNKHNRMMYEWSSQRKNMILITGHTHNPVFAAGKYLDHPSNKIITEKPATYLRPTYFNTGCCCFSDGDITGIEIEAGFIRLVKWYDEETNSKRIVLEEVELTTLVRDLG